MAVGLVTMIGLVPIGLTSMADSQTNMVRAQILQRVSGEAMLTSFTKLEEYVAQGPYFYDGQGQKQENLSAADQDTRFIVELSQLTTQYPGSNLAQDLPKSIATLSLIIKSNPNKDAPARYVVHVPNQG